MGVVVAVVLCERGREREVTQRDVTRQRDATSSSANRWDEAFKEIDWQRENDCGVLLGADGRERLQVAQLKSGWALVDNLRGLLQRTRRALLAFGRDHLRTRLTHRLGLRRHCALQLHRQPHVFAASTSELQIIDFFA